MRAGKRLVAMMLLLLAIGLVSCKIAPPTPLPETKLPEWQGIIVGQSTITDAIHLLGEPLQGPQGFPEDVLARLVCGDIQWWKFTDPSVSHPISVGISRTDGVVQCIRPNADSQAYPVTGMRPPTVEQFVEMYGDPERVTWGSGSEYERLYIWASKGIAIEGRVPAWVSDGTGAWVWWVEYFVPTDVETYLRTWGRDKWPRRGYGEEDAYHNPILPCPFSGTPCPND